MVALAGKKIKDKKNIIKDRLMGKRFKPKRKTKPPKGQFQPKPRPAKPKGQFQPKPRPAKPTSPPKARPLPRPKMLPPKRPRGTAPRLPSMKDLTPEQRKKVLQLIRGMRRT